MTTKLEGEKCPVCGENELTLKEEQKDLDRVGLTFVLSMDCQSCGYENSEIEIDGQDGSVEYVLEVEDSDDLSIEVAKSSQAKVDIPYVTTVEPDDWEQGFLGSVEGLLGQVKKILQADKQAADDKSKRSKLKNKVKKLGDVLAGREDIKLKIKDDTGNSAILSEQAEKK